jgi:hypothetical protein
MNTIRNDVIGGFNAFVNDQKKEEGICKVYYSQFNHTFKNILENADLKDVKPLDERSFRPAGSTRLLDALGTSINSFRESLDKFDDEEKPSKVIFVIITDGFENDSKEFKRDNIIKMIKEAEKEDWLFTYLAADQDAIKEGNQYGLTSSQSLTFGKSSKGVQQTYSILSEQVTNIRKGTTRNFSYTNKDRTDSI